MPTREECLLRAEDNERLAREADTEATREQFLATAAKWRRRADSLAAGPPADDARPLKG